MTDNMLRIWTIEESQHVLNQLFGLILATVLLSTPLLLQNGHYEIETDSRAPSLPKGFRLFADLERDKLPFVPNDQEPSAVPQETSATEDEKNEKVSSIEDLTQQHEADVY